MEDEDMINKINKLKRYLLNISKSFFDILELNEISLENNFNILFQFFTTNEPILYSNLIHGDNQGLSIYLFICLSFFLFLSFLLFFLFLLISSFLF